MFVQLLLQLITMLINEKTKISKLLQHHPDALETIVSLSPDFKKLRNPILRKLMAGRASIAMASKMGGCQPEDFFRALAPLGFEVDAFAVVEEEKIDNLPMPEYLNSLNPEQFKEFDVREMIESGKDPLRSIQEKVRALNAGEALKIITDFEPVPLVKLLERQGFESYVLFVDKDTIETFFYKTNASDTDETPELVAEISTSSDWDEVLKHFENKMVEIDVRHLEMPMPMMTILEALETLPADQALYVFHKKVPVFLLSELKDRAFEYRIKDVQEGEVYLLIYKEK